MLYPTINLLDDFRVFNFNYLKALYYKKLNYYQLYPILIIFKLFKTAGKHNHKKKEMIKSDYQLLNNK